MEKLSPDSPQPISQMSPASPQPISQMSPALSQPSPVIALPSSSSALTQPSLATTQANTGSKKKKRKAAEASTGKRQPWTIADNELLTKGVIHVSNNRIVENGQRSSDFWKRVLEFYMEGERSGVVRTSHNLRSHWHMIKHNVILFNNIVIQLREEKGNGWSEEQLKTQAHKKYHEEHNSHFIHEHVWNLVKNEPKWSKHIDIQESRKFKTSASAEDATSLNANASMNLDDGVDNIPVSVEDCEDDELPRPTKMVKAKIFLKEDEKVVEDVSTKLDNIFYKKVDMIEQFSEKMTQMLELKEKKLDMEILYKDRSQMDPETLAFHKEYCAMIREKYCKKK